jgi:phage FluMu protein Com
MTEVVKCPECGGVLEAGFIQLPSGAYWDTKEHKWRIKESRALISRWEFPMPNARAWKCPRCRLAIFEYKEDVTQ